MQKMFFFFSLLIANTMPHDIAAGRAGGTVTVIKSRPRSIMISEGTLMLIYNGIVVIIPTRARIVMIPTNLKPSV